MNSSAGKSADKKFSLFREIPSNSLAIIQNCIIIKIVMITKSESLLESECSN